MLSMDKKIAESYVKSRDRKLQNFQKVYKQLFRAGWVFAKGKEWSHVIGGRYNYRL